MRIVLINHTFQNERFCKRWSMLAKEHPEWDVTLLAPAEWTWGAEKSLTFGFAETKQGYELDDANFHIRMVKTIFKRFRGWTSDEMIEQIRRINPEVVYHIGVHTQESLMQILNYKKKCSPNLKVFAFSMRGGDEYRLSKLLDQYKASPEKAKRYLRYFKLMYEKKKVAKLNKYCDAIFCHYPDAVDKFKEEGFEKPIYMQTQVGVDPEIFYKNTRKREEMRAKLGLTNEFVFASAVRFNQGKGVAQILNAFPIEGNWKYVLMGSGTPEEVQTVKDIIAERKLDKNVILTGFIKGNDMADYWNVADCAIHFTQTTVGWVETFSLALVQAMATELPVVGSTSGSVPYQIGPDGMVVDENDIDALHNQLQWVIDHPEEAKKIGEKLYRRTIESFSIQHLNNLFYATVTDLMNGVYDPQKIDMANTPIR